MSEAPAIYTQFRKAYEADQAAFIKKWMVSWEYQDRRTRRKVNYSGGLPQNFYEFNGLEDFAVWFNWTEYEPKPNFFPWELVGDLARKSREFDERVFAEYGIDVDMKGYEKDLGVYNAQDYLFANFYPSKGDSDRLNVLDFGAGYGRQANLWSQSDKDLLYLGMDAIPLSYCLQHYYYKMTALPLHDYAEDPQGFRVDDSKRGIYHLPTWRSDLLPDNFFDRIITVQVLPELNGTLVKHMAKVFHRILKPNGALYIRDHGSSWRPGHSLDTDKVFADAGFALEYEAYLRDREDIHGIPRIWRKKDPVIEEQRRVSNKQRLKEMAINFDAATNGKVKKLLKGKKKSK